MLSAVIGEILARPALLTKHAYPRMSANQLEKTEDALGFALPGTLREIYLHVANGGIGPHFHGFMGGIDGFKSDGDDPEFGTNIVDHYHTMRSQPDSAPWPERLVTFFDWGGACRCAIDCTVGQGTVVYYDCTRFETRAATPEHGNSPGSIIEDVLAAMFVDAPSLDDWLRRWLAGTLAQSSSTKNWHPSRHKGALA